MTPTPHRRALLTGLGTLAVVAVLPQIAQAAEPALRINPGRLQRDLEALSVFGRPAGGTFADGVSRFAYSDADVAGRRFAMGLLRAMGVEPHIDTAGNILARREGSLPGLKPILIGSHIDSVPSGGNFDGALGSMAAIEVLRTLVESRVPLRHPIEVALWSNEEGGTVGSGVAVGALSDDALDITLNGVKRRDGLVHIGGDPAHLAEARLTPGSICAYLELHIEQSGSLETAGIPIGVVDGIVAIDEYEVAITGFANHAGTTPMPERRNALLAAAQFIEAVQEEVTRDPGRQVGTVGHLEVSPNVRNIVPGKVTLNLELRDLDDAKIVAIAQRISVRAEAIAAATRTGITMRQTSHDAAALAAPALQRQIETAAAGLGLKTLHLPSGAGHDAANLGHIGPMGMIFVPSHAGISHSPHELTSWADCANGANVLLQTVLRVDAEA